MAPFSKLMKHNLGLQDYCSKRKVEVMIICLRLTVRVLKEHQKIPDLVRKNMISNKLVPSLYPPLKNMSYHCTWPETEQAAPACWRHKMKGTQRTATPKMFPMPFIFSTVNGHWVAYYGNWNSIIFRLFFPCMGEICK